MCRDRIACLVQHRHEANSKYTFQRNSATVTTSWCRRGRDGHCIARPAVARGWNRREQQPYLFETVPDSRSVRRGSGIDCVSGDIYGRQHSRESDCCRSKSAGIIHLDHTVQFLFAAVRHVYRCRSLCSLSIKFRRAGVALWRDNAEEQSADDEGILNA